MTDFEYARPEPDEMNLLGRMLNQSLHFQIATDGAIDEWMARMGHGAFRLVRRGGRIAAGLRIIETGQWYGGRRVPAAAISAVGAAPEHRGQGATSFLMQRMHDELPSLGFPLAVLYPATLTFYRHSGYERAGAWNKIEVPTASIEMKDRDLDIEVVGEDGFDEIKRLYGDRAVSENGFLDRRPQMWQRILEPKEKKSYKYIVRGAAGAEGYVVYLQAGQFEPITITDMGAVSLLAARRILTFFADHRSMATQIAWRGGTEDPFVYILGEQRHKVTDTLDWVLRIVDVEQALSMRGYPPGARAELHLEISDRQIPANEGRFVLEVYDGESHVRRGGEGRIRIDIRTLASLYSGHRTASQLRICGRLDGPDADIRAADALFSGPRPWMPDIF